MDMIATFEEINSVWQQLKSPYRPGRVDGLRTAHESIVETGWGILADIEDVLWETDTRADALVRRDNVLDFIRRYSNLPLITRFRGPFGNTKQLIGHTSMRAADVAMYVMEIERLGFTVDAEPLVAALRPNLLRQKYLTNSEVSVVWYGKQRHKCSPILVRSDGARPTAWETVSTQTGYQATALLEDGEAVILRIDASKGLDRNSAKYWIQGELNRAQRQSAKLRAFED